MASSSKQSSKRTPAKASRAPKPSARKTARRSAATRRPEALRVAAPVLLLIETARRKQASRGHRTLAVHHWVAALRDLFPILPRDIPWDEMKVFEMKARLRDGDPGRAFSVEQAIEAAEKIAKGSGGDAATIDDVALAILDRAGLTPIGTAPPESGRAEAARAPKATRSARRQPGAAATKEAASASPMLDRFGRDLTREARQGTLPPIIDRQQEVALMIETLCRPKRRSISLIGPPGVGKRAIVEGLAHRIASGSVPAAIANLRIMEVQLPALLAGVTTLPELDQRFAQILGEARTSGSVLFFDELRTITSTGHDALTLTVSSNLKPEIARGITVIISGTEEDFLRLVELDSSIRPWAQQWFQPIRVEEMTAEATLDALNAIAGYTEAMTGVTVPPAVLKWIVSFAGELLKSHRFPGKAVDFFEQCVAHALSQGAKKVTLADAREVAGRAIAIPVDMESRLRRISKVLGEADLLRPEDAGTLVDRLSVTMRSLDLVPARPNAMVMLVGEATAAARALAETLADAVNGSTDRVIAIDFGLLTEAWDTRQLLGVSGPNAPAAVELPLHRLVEEPWSVILAEHVDACHPQVRASLVRGLSEGYFIDAKGKKLYMSDAAVVLTAPSIAPAAPETLGFGFGSRQAEEEDVRTVVARAFDAELVEQMDLVVSRLNRNADVIEIARHRSLLADLTKRYKSRGLDITWDKSLVEWFRAEPQQRRSRRDWEQWADKSLASVLIPHLPHRGAGPMKKVTVKREGDNLTVGQIRTSSSGRGR